MGDGALRIERAGVDELQTAASSILAPLSVTAPDTAAFRADIDAAALGRLAVARIRGSEHRVTRPPRVITSTDPEVLTLTLHNARPAVLDQGGRQGRAGKGDFVVIDMTRPYRLDVVDGCDVLAVGIPRAELGRHADIVARHAALRLPGDAGVPAALSALLLGLGRDLDELTGPTAHHVGDALVSLLLAAFTGQEPYRTDTATELVDRIRAYALLNISDPALCGESVARAHAISHRHLHRLFHRTGTSFATWLRQERLARIRRDLLDPAHLGLTVAGVAARWGCVDTAHMARTLKQQYGQTARELRQECVRMSRGR
ncbi:helix-turn-helix domain-containing protein [Streptomyces sp. NPDC001978]|uniref:AraC-like ligand-binding domain-containing protein n=1 Tax=Streptomyces sp. NPDC001978 TaxID=3364627 RepID=UPI00369E4427